MSKNLEPKDILRNQVVFLQAGADSLKGLRRIITVCRPREYIEEAVREFAPVSENHVSKDSAVRLALATEEATLRQLIGVIDEWSSECGARISEARVALSKGSESIIDVHKSAKNPNANHAEAGRKTVLGEVIEHTTLHPDALI
jgi:hypothetical protein